MKNFSKIIYIFLLSYFLSLSVLPLAPFAYAQNQPTRTLNSPLPPTNVNDSNFRLVVCDGPVLPASVPAPKANYVPCDFNGVMMTIQHLINVAMVLGVLVAIVGFSYAGFLYITSGPSQKKLDDAHGIFSKVGIGFIIMLSAWFIVYQILSWLTGTNSGFSSLLGTP